MSREPAPSTACCDARALLRVLAEASSATDCVRLTFHTSLNHSLVTPLAFRSIHRIHVHNTGSLRGRGALTFSRLYPSTRINSPPFSGCFVHILNMYRVRPGSTSKASVSTQGLFGAGPYSATNPSSPSQYVRSEWIGLPLHPVSAVKDPKPRFVSNSTRRNMTPCQPHLPLMKSPRNLLHLLHRLP